MDMSNDLNQGERETDYLAEGTSFEGTLNVEGDIEIRGMLSGEIAVSGHMALHSNAKCNVSARTLSLQVSTLRGDVVASDAVRVDSGSIVFGNVRAAAVESSGTIAGAIHATDHASFSSGAQLIGDIKTPSLEVAPGARLSGKIDMLGNMEG